MSRWEERRDSLRRLERERVGAQVFVSKLNVATWVASKRSPATRRTRLASSMVFIT